MPHVSVLIPTYNHARFIAQTLASALRQSYRDFEIILVNDGSTDDTVRRIKPFLRQIRYFYQPNSGPGAAYNLGLKHSRAEFVAFLNSDDLWAPDKLAQQVTYFQDHPEIGLVHTNFEEIDVEGETIKSNIHRIKFPAIGKCLENLIYGSSVACSSVMVKRSWLQKVGLFDVVRRASPACDFDLLLRLSEQGCLFGYLPKVLTKYRRHPSGIRESKLKYKEAIVYIFSKLLSRLVSGPNKANSSLVALAQWRLRTETFLLSIQYAREKQKRRAQHLLTNLIHGSPWDVRYYYGFAETLFPLIRMVREVPIDDEFLVMDKYIANPFWNLLQWVKSSNTWKNISQFSQPAQRIIIRALYLILGLKHSFSS